ncbi:DUF305 domain-containing protein [Pseudonocardia acaciae]|uniref:DUF305 domain-containing protein n=1 Tax=Pseudonocardia acaciae TaxID=551276 RepID=UPI001B80955B|nr:DUF305 domain-containing protein [Pseudonocardia acaciae]
MKVTLALATSGILAACGNTGASQAAPPSAPPASLAPASQAAEHNEADVRFAQQMIPHHTQAVRMAELAPTRAASAEVKKLASAIQAAQQPEIDQLNAMLARWGAPAAMPGMDHGTAHGAGHDMAGMMSDADMGKLGQAKAAEFDRQFLTMMIAHHEGAVAMSATELRDGRDAEAKALAQKITDAQRAEIDQMRRLLAG